MKRVILKRYHFYAVKRGRAIGIFPTWELCTAQVEGYSNALYKKFDTEHEAQSWLGIINVYTDGGCLYNGKEYAVGAIGIYFDKKKQDDSIQNISEPLPGAKQTSQRAELHAPARALEKIFEVKGDEPIVNILTDSLYVVNGVQKWKENIFNYQDNLDLWKNLFEKIKLFKYNITFIHVHGHFGISGNEKAHNLVQKALAVHK